MTMQLRAFIVTLLVLVLMTSACSGGGPTGPSPATKAAPAVSSAVFITVVSEETQAPVSGATVTIERGGAVGVTNSEGKVAFESVPTDTRIKFEHPGFTMRIASFKGPGSYGLLNHRGEIPEEFLLEFIFGDIERRGNTTKPKNNRIDVVLDHDLFRTSKIMDVFRRNCQKIEALGYGCGVFDSPSSSLNGTLALFRYGGESGSTELNWAGAGSHHTWTIRGRDVEYLESDAWILSRLISPLGLRYHSRLGGVASKVQSSSDFSEWEKRAIKMYLPRTDSTCFEDMVQLPVPNFAGATCSRQAPFGTR